MLKSLLWSILTALLLFACATANAATVMPAKLTLLAGSDAEGPVCRVDQKSDTVLGVEMELPFLEEVLAERDGQQYQLLSIPGGNYRGQSGQAALPVFSRLIAIPAGSDVQLRLVGSHEKTFTGYSLLPHAAQAGSGEISKSSDPDPTTEAFAPEVLVGEPALLGSLRVVPVTFAPVGYDPSTGELRVAERMSIELTFTGRSDKNVAGPAPSYIAESFDDLYQHTVLNYDRGAAQVGPGTYLMICPDNATVISSLQPLLDWRKRQGYNVLLATTTQTGTTRTAIKSYIQNLYDTLEIPLEFVSLAGDATGSYSIATWNESLSGYGGEGDHEYTLLAGGDVLSDIHIGRISYVSTGQLQTIVGKIVGYESDPYLASDPDWFTRAALVGDPSSSGMTTIYVNQWVKNQLIKLNYSEIDTIFASPFVSQMNTAFNQGGTILTYRGWLGMSGYSQGYIGALGNGEKLHFAVIMTCGTGSFANETECKSEAFLRAPNGGGVASIGTATIGTHTRYNNVIFHGVLEGALNMDHFQVGPALTRGKLELFNVYSGSEPDKVTIWSTWNNLMGDPATEIWTAHPKEIFVDHPASIATGAASVNVTVTGNGSIPLQGAKVSLFKEGQIQITGYTDAAGRVMLPLASHTAGSLLVTVTDHNFLPYLGSLTIGSTDTYLSYTSAQLDDDGSGASSGNGDGLASPGETLEYSLQLTNLGTLLAGSVSATLSSDDPYVQISENRQSYGDVGGGASAWSAGNYVFSLAAGTPAGHRVPFEVLATSGEESWSTLAEVTVYGGACLAEGYQFSGDGRLDPGDVGELSIELLNDGNLDIAGATAELISDSQWVNVTDAAGTYGAMTVGSRDQNLGDPFTIAIVGDCFPGHLATFRLLLSFASGATDTVVFQATVGMAAAGDPVGPDEYGYYAFDDSDADYPFAPTYEWVEIDPNYGGSGTQIPLTDHGSFQDDTKYVTLPFPFSYYGESYEGISVCSNGWICMGNNYLVHFRNYHMPCAGAPDAQIAVFWDDLYIPTGAGVYYWHDAANDRFIVQWSRLRNQYSSSYVETFQVMLYDPASHGTDTGDGIIQMQYQEVHNVDPVNGYATVGIQNQDRTDGLLYTYWNRYPTQAASLTAGRAITFQPVLPVELGFLEGDITNSTGGGSVVEGATIRIVESGRVSTSQANGHYFGSSPTGIYTVAVSHPSFEPDSSFAVPIDVGQTTIRDFALRDIGGPAIVGTTQHANTTDTAGPYLIETTITDYSPLAEMHFYYTSSSSGGPFELPLQLVDAGSGLYRAEIPGQSLGTRVQYWLTAADIAGNAASAPLGAPWENFAFMVMALSPIFADDMESDQGWTVGVGGDTAATGLWVRVDPNGVFEGSTEVQPEDDATPAPGVYCYITGNDPPGSVQGGDDVDGGATTLLSPTFDLSAYGGAAVSYRRWYTNDTGNAPGLDFWTVQVSADGGEWVTLENTNLSDRSWLERNFLLEDHIDLSSTVSFRFVASDVGAGSIVEAGVDEFYLTGYTALVDGEAPQVSVVFPNGGEQLNVDMMVDIAWQATDDIGVVMTTIELSTDGGATWPETLASGPLSSPWTWKVPDLQASTCRIRVICQDAVQNEASDISDANFGIGTSTGVDELPPANVALAQNQPNPFNPQTEIHFSLPRAQPAKLRVFDVEGRLIRTLRQGRQEAGAHTVIWNGKDDQGAQVASGLYFYRLETEGQRLTRKMLLLK